MTQVVQMFQIKCSHLIRVVWIADAEKTFSGDTKTDSVRCYNIVTNEANLDFHLNVDEIFKNFFIQCICGIYTSTYYF